MVPLHLHQEVGAVGAVVVAAVAVDHPMLVVEAEADLQSLQPVGAVGAVVDHHLLLLLCQEQPH